MQVVSLFAALFSVLVPAKMWYGVKQAVEFKVDSKEDVTLVLTDFSGKPLPATGSADASPGKMVDAKSLFPQISALGTYVLYAVPKGKAFPISSGHPSSSKFGATRRRPAASVTRIEPLQYAVMETANGPLKMIFYYDVAPLTVDNFLKLSEQGYYDGLTFHRIVPGFVIQAVTPGEMEPAGRATASMPSSTPARTKWACCPWPAQDPNSAGSQFFVCLDYAHTKQLDRKYTAFGKVISGMDAVNKIAATPLADERNGTPKEVQPIKSVTVKPVTPQDNPYADFFKGK